MAANSDNMLSLSWRDTAWLPVLNQGNVMDYFSERSNPFYDKNCNNESIKMQRLSPEQLHNMTGVEYILLHVQEPILYVIRKQHRHSPTAATPLLDYYIIAGTVYQAPDLCSVVNSRLLNCMHSLQSAFEEAQSYSRYHPSRGYWWAFKDSENTEGTEKEKKKKKKEEPSSYFQRQRVDVLLGELAKKYPPKIVSSLLPEKPKEEVIVKQEKTEIKVERPDEPNRVPATTQNATANQVHKPPPEKKPKLIR